MGDTTHATHTHTHTHDDNDKTGSQRLWSALVEPRRSKKRDLCGGDHKMHYTLVRRKKKLKKKQDKTVTAASPLSSSCGKTSTACGLFAALHHDMPIKKEEKLQRFSYNVSAQQPRMLRFFFLCECLRAFVCICVCLCYLTFG
jgi:hypothetical protein